MAKILVVDDELELRKIFAQFLKMNGYEVVECSSGAEALEKWDPTIRYVLSDIQMPEMEGTELARRLLEKNPKLVIVLTTGNGEVFDKVSCSKELYGVKEVVMKPPDSFNEFLIALGI
ncbi:MAG: response regulator [bacterium]